LAMKIRSFRIPSKINQNSMKGSELIYKKCRREGRIWKERKGDSLQKEKRENMS